MIRQKIIIPIWSNHNKWPLFFMQILGKLHSLISFFYIFSYVAIISILCCLRYEELIEVNSAVLVLVYEPVVLTQCLLCDVVFELFADLLRIDEAILIEIWLQKRIHNFFLLSCLIIFSKNCRWFIDKK